MSTSERPILTFPRRHPRRLSTVTAWWDILQVDPSSNLIAIEDSYRRLANVFHADDLAKLNAAIAEARRPRLSPSPESEGDHV